MAGIGQIGVTIVDDINKVVDETDIFVNFTNPEATVEYVQVAKNLKNQWLLALQD